MIHRLITMNKISNFKKVMVALWTLMFTFLFYFENSFSYMIDMRAVFYKDYMFYIAVAISFCSGLFTVSGFKEKKKEQ